MSHYTVLVVSELEPTEALLEAMLAPFEEGKGDDESKWKWDWWVRGGRWQGMLKPKQSTETIKGEPGVFDNKEIYTGGVDSLQLSNLDLEGMKDEAGKAAAAQFDKAAAIINGREFPTFEEIRSKYSKDKIQKARDEYWAHPVISALSKEGLLPLMEGPALYRATREAFIKDAKNQVFTTHAILHNSEWVENGQMGWFGVSSESNEEEWAAKYADFLDSLKLSTWLTIVDCHI